MMSDLHHGSIERLGGGGCELDDGCDMDASLTVAVMRVRKAQAIGGGGCRCEGKEAKYETLEVNPLVL